MEKAQKASERLATIKTTVIYSLLGLGTAGGLVLLGGHLIRKGRKRRSEKKSLDYGSPSTYAKQLKMAFDNDNWAGWGTNEELIFQVFREIPSRAAYNKVQNEYFNLYGRDLNSDLESELSASEYNETIRILGAKPIK